MNRRAILSVYDKTDIVKFAWGLADLGWELVASGGTARLLDAAGLDVVPVSSVTGAAEMLGGRVKTLHPAIHGAILARDTPGDQAELLLQGIETIDLVVSNLYPFQETITQPDVTLEQAVEQIDVGGVTLLRAAAKNFARVTVLCDPADYESVLAELREKGSVGEVTRRRLAVKAFTQTRDYDAIITTYLKQLDEKASASVDATGNLPDCLALDLVKLQPLRYGENPHQAAALYGRTTATDPLGDKLLQGKVLSYNNLLDLDAAWQAATSFGEPSVVIVKHLSPCGIATAETPAAAFPLALASDPISAFGSVIAVNRPVEDSFITAADIAGLFVEAIIAPAFSEGVQTWFKKHKRNCRLVALEDDAASFGLEIRGIRGGYIVQERDRGDPESANWQVVSQLQPAEIEWPALRFGWRAVQYVKSNAIVLAGARANGVLATVGIGGGQPSRVDAVRIAVAKAGDRASGAVMASDAFFPFADGLELATEVGIKAVIQPGGSVRDEEVINTANRLGLALVFTGIRHFKH